MKLLTILFNIFICAILITNLQAQNKYKTLNNSDIVEYRKKDGLPSNNFTNVVLTQDGYIWFSGPEGTFRFDGYEFAYLAEEYGIPEMQSVYYDSTKNILYFASPEKFASFDGKEFKVYDISDGYKLNENKGQIISFIKSDSRGRIWVGSYTPWTDKPYNGSLLYFKDEKFNLYDTLSFPLDNAKSFIESPFGELIFTSFGSNTQTGNGAYIALFKDEKFTKIDEKYGFKYVSAVSTDNYSSNVDLNGNTWIAFHGSMARAIKQKSMGSGVLFYDGENFKDFPGLEKYLTIDTRIAEVFCDIQNDKVYASLIRAEPKKITSSDYQIFELVNNRWEPSPIIKQISEDSRQGNLEKLNFNYYFSRFLKSSKDRNLTLAFSTIGIAQSSTDPSQFFIYENDSWKIDDAYNGIPFLDLLDGTLLTNAKGIGFLTPTGSIMLKKEDGVLIPEITIPNLYPDRKGLVWITYSYSSSPAYITLNRKGLNVWDGTKLRKLSDKDGLKSNMAFPPYQDRNFNVWIPTDKGITRLREIKNNKGEWIFKLKNIELKNGEDYNTSEILETKNNDIYVYQNFVRPEYLPVTKAEFFLGRISDEKIIKLDSPFRKELTQLPYQLFNLREDSKGNLWLEGNFAKSVEQLSSVNLEIKVFNGNEWTDPPNDWNVPNEQLHFVGELHNGSYYISADKFYKFDGNTFIDLSDSTDQFADYTLLKGASVAGTQTNIQAGEYLYVRMRGRGLVVFDGKNLKYLTPRNSLVPTDIHNPVTDHLGNLFFGSHAGAVKLNGYKVNLFYDDENITAGGAAKAAMDMNGNIIKFYTGVGIAVEKHIKKTNDVVISSITINENAYYYKFPTSLSYSENSFLFNYSVLNFSNPDQTMYEHFLEGYDKEWSRSSNLSFTEYQNLPPGNFTFIVKATVANSEIAKEASYSFNISPPFWNTWWAYLSYIFIFLGFLYSIRKIELKRQKKNAAIKESQLRAETAEFQAKAAEAQSRVIQAENDRKSKELEEARELQLSMLPKEVPSVPNLDIAVYMKTATEVGGDYYDFSIKDDGSLNIALGDATGHGMKAGTLVTMMKSLFTANSTDKELKEFFTSSNTSLKKSNLERMMIGLAMLNIKEYTAELINAGLPSIYLYKKLEDKIEELNIHSLPLGALSGDKYSVTKINLQKDDVILMLTDGFPELQNENEELYGYERVMNSFKDVADKSPDEIINSLKEEGSKWVGSKEPDDDVTFVVIKVK